nr:tautomerase family protein [uncultured Moellerella sp.]
MPLWTIYHPEQSYNETDKQQIAAQITALYDGFLPKFYVNVLFTPLTRQSLYIGGEATDDFVRISVDHIARHMNDPQMEKQFLQAISQRLAPFIEQRGYRWEIHIDDTPYNQWTINGIHPPKPGSDAFQTWYRENKPSNY